MAAPDGTATTTRREINKTRQVQRQSDSSSTISTGTYNPTPASASIPDFTPISVSVPSLASADSLADFYERGISAPDWSVFTDAPSKEPLRIVYTGTAVANLNSLTQTSSRALHFPFPPIKPRLSWEPNTTSRTYLTAATVKDLCSLPPKNIRDSLIDTYFSYIHPSLPIVDAAEFHHQYRSSDPSPPLLLLQCMLLAAARVSEHAEVADSRLAMTTNLYSRAKALFEMRHENDRVILVQAALLMTWYVEDSDSVSNGPYYWVGSATRMAMGLGMHRDLSDNSASRMPLADRKLYRRLWWATLRLEVYTALEYGRPSMIRAEDFDQPPLQAADFLCGDGTEDQFANQKFCILDARLSVQALSVIRLAAPGTTSTVGEEAAVDIDLVRLAAELPSSSDFWSCQLHITHSLLTLMLYRVRRYSDPDSDSAAQEAISTILVSFETIMAQHNVAHLGFYACTPLLAAAIHLAQSISTRTLAASNMKAYTSHVQLERLLKPIQTLAKTWPHMDSVSRLSTLLSSHCRKTVFRKPPSTEETTFDLVDITLDDLLNEYCFSNVGG